MLSAVEVMRIATNEGEELEDAFMNGKSLHVAGRLLGHRQTSTTNRYVHLDDATLSQAAGRVAETIGQKLNYDQQHDSVRPSGDASLGKR